MQFGKNGVREEREKEEGLDRSEWLIPMPGPNEMEGEREGRRAKRTDAPIWSGYLRLNGNNNKPTREHSDSEFDGHPRGVTVGQIGILLYEVECDVLCLGVWYELCGLSICLDGTKSTAIKVKPKSKCNEWQFKHHRLMSATRYPEWSKRASR